jgi:hypothetical protein
MAEDPFSEAAAVRVNLNRRYERDGSSRVPRLCPYQLQDMMSDRARALLG